MQCIVDRERDRGGGGKQMATNLLKGGTAIGVRLLFPFTQINSRIYTNYDRIRISTKKPNLISPPPLSYSRSSSFCTAASAATDASASSSSSPSSEAGSGATAAAVDEALPVSEEQKIKDAADVLDIRVGQIVKAWRHEEADSLYVEEVDIGEPENRTICSGLVKYVPLDYLQDRNVVVLANLKPRNMRGVKSSGMLMAASDASHENVELLVPPEGSLPGERIWFGSEEDHQNQPPPATPNQIQKKKIWELVQPHLKTNDSCVAILGEHVMWTSAGVVISRSLKNANIS